MPYPIGRGDAAGLVAFHEGLSRETVRSRFFTAKPTLSLRRVEHFPRVDHHDRVALVAGSAGSSP